MKSTETTGVSELAHDEYVETQERMFPVVRITIAAVFGIVRVASTVFTVGYVIEKAVL